MPKKSSKPIGTYRPDAIDIAVSNLINACGFKGESGTDEFYYLLQEAIDSLDGTIEKSHEEGLCYDMSSAIAHAIKDILNKQSGLLN